MLLAPEFEESAQLAKFRINESIADIVYDVSFKEHIELRDSEFLYVQRGIEFFRQSNYIIRVIRHDKTREIVMMDIAKTTQIHKVLFLNKYPKAWGETMVIKIMNFPENIIYYQGIFLHASFIVWNGEAILFSGKKQIGKSTQARLWYEYKNVLIANGDRAILKKINGKWFACGTPYCGTSQICENICVPIRCIVILQQGCENWICDASVREAFVSLLKNCSYDTWNKEQMNMVLSLTEKISTEVQFVKLFCLPDQSSVKILEEYLCQNLK